MKQHERLAAVYCRTAHPDDFSILVQKDRLIQLANTRSYDNLEYYQDNGYSDLSFERPAFLQMCEDIQIGKIQYVLVVDTSRIGRNGRSVSKWLNEMRLTGVFIIPLDDEPYPDFLINNRTCL